MQIPSKTHHSTIVYIIEEYPKARRTIFRSYFVCYPLFTHLVYVYGWVSQLSCMGKYINTHIYVLILPLVCI